MNDPLPDSQLLSLHYDENRCILNLLHQSEFCNENFKLSPNTSHTYVKSLHLSLSFTLPPEHFCTEELREM